MGVALISFLEFLVVMHFSTTGNQIVEEFVPNNVFYDKGRNRLIIKGRADDHTAMRGHIVA